jgi:preprotein translocase subunit YajC
MYTALILLADDPPNPSAANPLSNPIFLIVGLFFLFWLLVLRPMSRRQQQERDALVSNLKKNDKVITTAGIIGTVISVAEKEDEVVVKVDDNCRLRMIKGSIARNLTNEEAAKAAKEAKKAGAA